MVRKLDPEKVRQFKAEALRRGLLLHQALEEAITMWLNAGKASMESDFEANNRVYESMKEELRKNHPGRYVLIAEGRLVGVFAQEAEAVEALRRLGEKTRHAILTKVGVDEKYVGELEWWGGSMEH